MHCRAMLAPSPFGLGPLVRKVYKTNQFIYWEQLSLRYKTVSWMSDTSSFNSRLCKDSTTQNLGSMLNILTPLHERLPLCSYIQLHIRGLQWNNNTRSLSCHVWVIWKLSYRQIYSSGNLSLYFANKMSYSTSGNLRLATQSTSGWENLEMWFILKA